MLVSSIGSWLAYGPYRHRLGPLLRRITVMEIGGAVPDTAAGNRGERLCMVRSPAMS